MLDKEIKNYLDTLNQGLAEAEKKMLQEKAARNEEVVNCDETGEIVRIPAKQIISEHSQYL